MVELGRLVEVSVRDTWGHEAHEFTPWIAEHIEYLSAAIGVPLELEKSEVAVDTFFADILARNQADGTGVLIENQLCGSDHTHLGQIMTYLAGLDVKTIVWIAPSFRDAHLSAVKWLNENTVDQFSFFAVRVKVLRIDDSRPAPVFEVVERPNEWDRYVEKIIPKATSERSQIRLAFWTQYVEKYPEELEHGQPAGVVNRWNKFPHLGVVISMVFNTEGVGIFLRGMHGTAPNEIIEILSPHRKRLEVATGSAHWNAEGGYVCSLNKDANTNDQATWVELSDWLYEQVTRYRQALSECFPCQEVDSVSD